MPQKWQCSVKEVALSSLCEYSSHSLMLCLVGWSLTHVRNANMQDVAQRAQEML